MSDNVIRFPGFLVPEDRNGCWKDCKFYPRFTDMVRELPERDRARTYQWQVKREGRGAYRSAVLNGLAVCKQGGGAA